MSAKKATTTGEKTPAPASPRTAWPEAKRQEFITRYLATCGEDILTELPRLAAAMAPAGRWDVDGRADAGAGGRSIKLMRGPRELRWGATGSYEWHMTIPITPPIRNNTPA
jgi:hypothetical protein